MLVGFDSMKDEPYKDSVFEIKYNDQYLFKLCSLKWSCQIHCLQGFVKTKVNIWKNGLHLT